MKSAAELTPERRDELIGSVARWIVRRRLETPATFMIEMNRPLAVMGANACHFGAPILGPVFGERFLKQLGLLMEERSNVDRLTAEIERRVAKRDSAAPEPTGGED